MKLRFLLTLILFLTYSKANATISDQHQNQGAKTRAVASFYHNEKGEKKLIAGIEFELAEGWKIYGEDAGGFGLPPSIDFSGSSNYLNHKIIWPEAEKKEEKIGESIIHYSYYKHKVILPVEIIVQKIDDPTNLNIKLNYGLCSHDLCVPVTEEFSIIPSSTKDADALDIIQKFYPHKISETKQIKQGINSSYALIAAIFLGILGGAILNIMPCVLPVLSLKLMSVINHSNAALSRIRLAFLSTVIGILFCFIVFAFIASFIEFSGNSLGWGLQFQNSYFLIFLVTILAFFTLNLFGLFEINFNQILANFINRKIEISEQQKNIFIPNFLSGILAVLLATPCSAPFLGSAISFALTQSFITIFIIFISIALGFASPYIVLFFTPGLVRFLPKPGRWMITAKHIMGWFFIVTILWLLYVLKSDIGGKATLITGALCLALLPCFKIKSKLFRNIALIFITIMIFAIPSTLENKSSTTVIKNNIWHEFNEAEIYKQVINGKTVVVDITADWCLTCKFNKAHVLEDKEVMAILKGGDIILMRGDLTKPNPEIMDYLHKNGRFAIPFNAVYGPNAREGLLASELLSKKELLTLIKKAS